MHVINMLNECSCIIKFIKQVEEKIKYAAWRAAYLLFSTNLPPTPPSCGKMSYSQGLTLYSIITPLKYLKYENIMENRAFCSIGANAPLSIIFSNVFKTFLKLFLNFFIVV